MFIGAIIGVATAAYGAYSANKTAKKNQRLTRQQTAESNRIAQFTADATIYQANLVGESARVLQADSAAMSAFSRQMASANRALAMGAAKEQLNYRNAASNLKSSSLVLIKHDAAFQTRQLETKKDLVKRQAKADALIRQKSYNKVMENAMVQTAASQRVMGEGSVAALFRQSEENFNWETMWNKQNTIISVEAIKADQAAIAYSSKVKYKLGEAGVTVDKIGARAEMIAAQARACSGFNSAMVGIKQNEMMTKHQVASLEANAAGIRANAAGSLAQANLASKTANSQAAINRSAAVGQGLVGVGNAAAKFFPST